MFLMSLKIIKVKNLKVAFYSARKKLVIFKNYRKL